jgi:hypothetical protein
MIVLNFINSLDTTEELPQETIALINESGIWTIDGAFLEFKEIYEERIPYKEVPMLDGPCYKWDETFINYCLLAMSTDRMVQFSTDELTVWRYFVNFQNYHSTSARETNAYGTAIGCTNPNSKNESFVVAGDGTILDGTNGKRRELCQPPGYEIEGEQIWSSLDKVFMAIYNCQEINQCTNNDIIEDVSPCNITQGQ